MTEPRPWVNNEDGPTCSCGAPTVVKLDAGGAILLCLFHTAEAGASFELPATRPADWYERLEEGNE